jgi:hypothetical protein
MCCTRAGWMNARSASFGGGENDMAKRKPYDQMNAAQLETAKAEYDKPWTESGVPGKPLTAAQRAVHGRASAKAMGRPMVGEGAKIVPVSIERGLLKEADTFAKRHKLKRSQMVAQGLRLVMQQRAG